MTNEQSPDGPAVSPVVGDFDRMLIVEVGHAWYPLMRYPWPWGLLFPTRLSCLKCGKTRRQAARTCPQWRVLDDSGPTPART